MPISLPDVTGVIVMRDRRWGRARAALVALSAALATVGLATAQNAAPKGNAKVARGNNRAGPGKPAAKRVPAADPLAGAQGKTGIHYSLKLTAPDRTELAAIYYPSKLGTNASAVLLVHEKDRSSKDFEEPISDLKGLGLAEHLQDQGYAVLAIDLRGQGANARRPTSPKDWKDMVLDLQTAYQFLVDRTNRGELNLSKLVVVGLGEGANLAAAWANMPGGAVSNQGRTSDLCALILISPMADGEGLLLREALAALAPRFPMLVLVGERDQASHDPVRAARPVVERPVHKLNRVETFDTSLHGYKLLRLEPKVTASILRFLEGMAKFKSIEWEPRYNLAPISFQQVAVLRNAGARAKEVPAPAPAPAPAAKEKEQEKEKEKEPAPK